MNNFVTLISKYKLNFLLDFLANASKKIFDTDKGFLEYNYYTPIGNYKKKTRILVTSWDLLEISYYAILYCNDNNLYIINSTNEFIILVNEYHIFNDEISKRHYDKFSEKKHNILYQLLGMSFEQFSCQEKTWIIEDFNRYYHIICKLANEHPEYMINTNDVIETEVNMQTDCFVQILVLIFCLAQKDKYILDIPESYYFQKQESILTYNNLKQVVDYYSTKYNNVRESKLGKQILYTKPFIITQNDKVFSPNFFLIPYTFSNGLYWIVINYYYKQNSQRFVTAFGHLFDIYIEELLNKYIRKENYKRIMENKEKSADFIIEFDKFVFIVEEKSSLLSLMSKNQLPDIELIDKFIQKNISQAIAQLDNSSKHIITEKILIKVILLLENFRVPEVIEMIYPSELNKDKLLWIITIHEFERLLALYKNDPDIFNKVIDDKYHLELEKSNQGRTLTRLLSQYNQSENEYIINEINYFEKFTTDIGKYLKN